MDYKDGKWAGRIIELQRDDGTWGRCFHTLSRPDKSNPITTEQVLRRLRVLGFTLADEPIRKAVDCMTACLRGECQIDDYWEKTHDWALFTKLMLSTWVKLFDPENESAMSFACQWAEVVERAFASGSYDQSDYVAAYVSQFASRPRGGREINIADFYHVSLLRGVLTARTESLWLDYILSHPQGVYYIYEKLLREPPEVFTSKEASRYLAALELLTGYRLAGEKLGFAVDWLDAQKDVDGQWDFGPKANDGVYFPLSDSWRKAEDRKADCTERVNTFLRKLGS